jgi:hypothetical protein
MATNKGSKKRGNPSSFQGQRAEFLAEWNDAYTEASRQKKTLAMWSKLFAAYWVRFPWRFSLMEDPLETDDTSKTPGAMEVLTAAEQAQKTQIMKDTEKVRTLLCASGAVPDLGPIENQSMV